MLEHDEDWEIGVPLDIGIIHGGVLRTAWVFEVGYVAPQSSCRDEEDSGQCSLARISSVMPSESTGRRLDACAHSEYRPWPALSLNNSSVDADCFESGEHRTDYGNECGITRGVGQWLLNYMVDSVSRSTSRVLCMLLVTCDEQQRCYTPVSIIFVGPAILVPAKESHGASCFLGVN